LVVSQVIFVTSDWHLGHFNITEFCGRPQDWFERIWSGLECIRPEDTLIHLGDYAFRQGPGSLRAFWARMPLCKRILVMGNHDKRSRSQKLPWDAVVTPIQQPLMVGYPGTVVLLSHRPGLCPDGFAGIDIFGHIHEKGQRLRWDGSTLHVNACVEHWAYRPFTLAEVYEEYRLIESEKSA
jgi:calcineurin-like phosphoesterase family protein